MTIAAPSVEGLFTRPPGGARIGGETQVTTRDATGDEAAGGLTTSIVVPTFNRSSRLERLLRRLDELHAAGDRFETVVSVDGSSDGTPEMLAKLRVGYPLTVVMGENGGPCAARNRGMNAASGEVILFLDDDVTPRDGLIERHLAIHRRDPQAAVIGPMLPPAGVTMPPWLAFEAAMMQRQYALFASGLAAPTHLHFYTANASLRRSFALAAGGFDEKFKRQDDVEYAYRLAAAGAHFYFVPKAEVIHEPDRTLSGFLRMAYENGRYSVLMERKGHPHGRAVAYVEARRNRLNRLPPRLGVGHPLRTRAMVAALTAGIRYRGPGHGRVQRSACHALYNLLFWQGYAAEMGLGSRLWRQLETEWRASAQFV